MPLYEYLCKKCETTFELLVRSDTELACPECGGTELEKLLSAFSAPAGEATPCDDGSCPGTGASAPGCAGGSCPFA
jgi:putative FmdB family regulatory protein